MSETAPEISMTSAERDRLIVHITRLRNAMAETHPRIAAWANSRLIELCDERSRQADLLAELERDLDL